MKKSLILILATTTLSTLFASSAALAQIGPDLVPPGLEPGHPIDSYTSNSRKKLVEDWRHAASWELNTGDVVFSAAKKRQLISEAPSTIHVITDRDILAHGWRSLPEILRHVPGVQTQMTKSQFQSVMIRGLVGTEDNNSRILWLQNGVPMNDVRDSGIWLDETYPVEMIKRIEVVLGPGSALYGSGAFQGVVNIFTKDPADIDQYGEYRLALQNNMTFRASAIAAYTSDDGDLGILGHVTGNYTNGPGLIGDYVYTNYAMAQSSANINANQDATALRADSINPNSDKAWYSVNFKLNYKALKWDLGFTDIYAGADGNEFVPNTDYNTLDPGKHKLNGSITIVPNKPGLEESGHDIGYDRYSYRFNRREFYTDLIYEDNFGESVSFLALLSYRLNVYDHKHYRNYRDGGELDDYLAIFGRPHDIELQTQISNDISAFRKKVDYQTFQHKLYGLAQVQWRIYEANELIGGLVLEYQNITSPDFMNGLGMPVRKETGDEFIDAQHLAQVTPSVFIQDEQRFWNDRIILTAGARFDAYRIYMSGDKKPDYVPSWRFAFLGKWTDWMTMRLSYGYSFKEPSLFQLYVDTFDYRGNPDLDPEKLHNVELSFLFTPLYFMKIRVDGFATLMNNLIINQYNTDYEIPLLGEEGRYYPKDKVGANLFGFEISLDTSIGDHWNLYTHYNFLYSTYTSKENTNDNQNITSDNSQVTGHIPNDAMHRFKLGASYLSDAFTADMALFLVGGTPKTPSEANAGQDYATPFYAILQPQINVALPANLGLMLQGSYAFSEGMLRSPTYRYYYEKEGVPVSRYTFSIALMYPFKK